MTGLPDADRADSGACDQAAVETSGGLSIFQFPLGLAFMYSGQSDEARAIFETLIHSSLPALYVLVCHHMLGDDDTAYAAFERGIEQRSDWMYSLERQPWLRDLRHEPRFQDVVARMRLPPLIEG